MDKQQRLFSFYSQSLMVGLLYMVSMTIFRICFFLYFNETNELFSYDIFHAFFLGFRLDLTVLGYTLVLPFVFSIFAYIFDLKFYSLFKYYYFVIFILLLVLMGSDFGFYSFFKEHINILIFGLFDDDTTALIKTMWDNYPVVWILSIFFVVVCICYYLVNLIFKKTIKIDRFLWMKNMWILFPILSVLLFLMIRGTLGMYPLGKMLPNISTHAFINKVSQNSTRSFIRAYKLKSKYNRNFDLIKNMGFENNIEEAFKIYTHKSLLKKPLIDNLIKRTGSNGVENLNIVVVMTESFGLPVSNYNSDKFDILGHMKKHFEDDILFRNFTSSGDGTIRSLEALILNIAHRPNSFPFSQSKNKQVSFDYTPAFIYKKRGYETTFIYGGDLTWRDIGAFISFQGYDHVEGKMDIKKGVGQKENMDYFHPWGIFDEFLFEYVEKKLKNAKKPQFIFVLTTNNHPPFNIPKQYKSKPLTIPPMLEKHLTSNKELAIKRFYSYQYAVDQEGIFLDKIASDPKLKDNTIVAVTADNNTIDGIMTYPDHELFNSKNIPFLLYLPKKLKSKVDMNATKHFGSQKDIFPTLFNLTLKNVDYYTIGNDLFSKDSDFVGMNGSGVVSTKDQTINANTSNSPLAQYYKATLSVQEYLLQHYIKKAHKK